MGFVIELHFEASLEPVGTEQKLEVAERIKEAALREFKAWKREQKRVNCLQDICDQVIALHAQIMLTQNSNETDTEEDDASE